MSEIFALLRDRSHTGEDFYGNTEDSDFDRRCG